MPGSAFVAAVGAVDWSALRSTYESGEVVRDIVLRLGSPDPVEVRWAWEQIGETVLQHQGTVYPATAAAAPFLCQYLGPTVYSPVLGATQLAARLRAGEDPENDAFSCVHSLNLMGYGGNLIDHPR